MQTYDRRLVDGLDVDPGHVLVHGVEADLPVARRGRPVVGQLELVEGQHGLVKTEGVARGWCVAVDEDLLQVLRVSHARHHPLRAESQWRLANKAPSQSELLTTNGSENLRRILMDRVSLHVVYKSSTFFPKHDFSQRHPSPVIEISVTLVVKGHHLEEDEVVLVRLQAGDADPQRGEHPSGGKKRTVALKP